MNGTGRKPVSGGTAIAHLLIPGADDETCAAVRNAFNKCDPNPALPETARSGLADRMQRTFRMVREAMQKHSLPETHKMLPILWARLFSKHGLDLTAHAGSWIRGESSSGTLHGQIVYEPITAKADPKATGKKIPKVRLIKINGLYPAKGLLAEEILASHFACDVYKLKWNEILLRKVNLTVGPPDSKTTGSPIENKQRTERTRALGDYQKRYGKFLMSALLAACKKEAAKRAVQLVLPQDEGRPYRSDLRNAELVKILRERYPNLKKNYTTGTLQAALPYYVETPQGRPKRQPKSNRKNGKRLQV